MGRKHKSNSLKYIKQDNEKLKQENKYLQQMLNNGTARNIEMQKKIVELENYNNGLIEILNIQKEANDFQQQKIEILETNLSLLNEQKTNLQNSKSNFSKELALACSIKINKNESENEDNNKIYEIE